MAQSIGYRILSAVMLLVMVCPVFPGLSLDRALPHAEAADVELAMVTAAAAAPALEPAPAPTPLRPAPAAVPASVATLFGPPSPPSPPRLALVVRVAPEEAVAGETVTFTVRLANAGGLAADVVVSGTLPLGLDCAACERFYDPGTRQLRWALDTLPAGQVVTRAFAVQVQAAAGWEGGVLLSLQARGAETPRAALGSALVRVPYPREDAPVRAVLPSGQAGRLVSADGRVTVTVPAEALPVSLTVVYTPTAALVEGYHHPLRHFQLTAYDAAGRAVHTFTTPIEIAYRYTWAEVRGLLPAADLHLVRWDEEAETWVNLSSRVDAERRLLVGQTQHFSEMQSEYIKLPSDDYLPAVQGFQEIDLYSGAASYAYPLEVPPGQGGLTPQLTLSYNSAAADWPAHPEDPLTQAAWVGYGWSLDVGSIGRQNVGGYRWGESPRTEHCEGLDSYSAEDVFTLVLNGAGHDLVLGADGSYHTAEETYWRIWPEPGGGEEGPHAWYVQTKDGVTYTFALTLVQVICEDAACDADPERYHHEIYKWLLTEVEDTHGNTIAYEYAFTIGPDCFGIATHRAAYLLRVTYNGGRTKVETRLPQRADIYAPENPNRCPQAFSQDKYLEALTVSVKPADTWQVARTYTLTYDYDTYSDDLNDPGEAKLTLHQVQVCGYNGVEQACLPPTLFTYYAMETMEGAQVGRNRLWTATNSYSGSVSFSYENLPTEPIAIGPGGAWRNRVITRTVDDGLAGTPPYTWTYRYAGTARNWPWIAGTVCDGVSADAGTDQPRAQPVHEFRGHAVVTVTDPLGDVQVHSYALSDTLHGKEIAVVYQDSQGAELRRTAQNYAYFQVTPFSPMLGDYYTWAEPEIAFVYVQTATVVEYAAAGPLTRTTAYSYSEALQGGAQHGNVTHVREYDEGGDLYRTTLRGYYSNTVDWIVDRVRFENVYSTTAPLSVMGDPYSYWRSSIYYGYDGQDPLEDGSVPDVGDLTRVMRVLTFTADVVTPTDYLATTVDTGYGYDEYGNRITETVYNTYGYCAERYPSTGQDHWECDPASANPRTVTITYDAVFHLYPITVTYPNGRSETAGYDYVRGLLTAHTDVNGATTNYLYDGLGRVNKVVRPGDTNGKPTVHVKYEAWGTPGEQRVEIERFTFRKSGELLAQDNEVVREERYFDGLGRLLQVHQEDRHAGNWEVVQTTLYDALGRVQAALVPYTITAAAAYVAPAAGIARTEHGYDALGRAVVVTNTDGTTVTTYYDGWRTAVVDELGHMVIRENDAFGRLVAVREYTGTYDFANDPAWDEPPYAVTVYGYDVLDRLAAVTDTAANVTRLWYDRLGRKVAMADPDMGDWSYGYDPLGNLITQTDALEQVITFTYDLLSRLVTKTLPAGASAVHFCYDDCRGDADAAHSWGRVRWAWVGADFTANGHAYGYDERGRTTTETLWVADAGYTTTTVFDSMDRVSTTTYPDGEVITQTYDDEGAGLLVEVEGDDVYVSGMTYTATRAVALLELGSGPVLTVTYGYYNWKEEGGRGRLAGITAGIPTDTDSLQDLNYTYDLVGNVLVIEDYKAGSPQTQEFEYDALNRLTKATADGTSGQGGYGPEGYHYSEIGNITVKGDLAYGYQDPAHAHAVTHLTYLLQTDQRYWYDANGNQVKRIVGGETYTLTYDPENHLTEVVTAGGRLAAFGYGPGGERITGTVGATATVYVGAHYEAQTVGQTETVRKYYYAGGKRVAMREDETLYFLLADHLGSQAITVEADGAKFAEVRYKAWGEDRYTTDEATPTSFRYTGQRSEALLGLHYYGARWYDPYLGRFTQPDTMVPNPGNPQRLNRFSYAGNGPVTYADVAGRCIPCECPYNQDILNPLIVDPSAHQQIVLVGLSSIPRESEVQAGTGIINVNYASDFSTLGWEGSPRDAVIVYNAPQLDPSNDASWENLDSRDLVARTQAQEAVYSPVPGAEDSEMVGVNQNARERVRQDWLAPKPTTLNGVLMDGYAFRSTALSEDENYLVARGNWANPAGNPRYERSLAISVGVDERWLYDSRTYLFYNMRGYGTYNAFYFELVDDGVQVTDYP